MTSDDESRRLAEQRALQALHRRFDRAAERYWLAICGAAVPSWPLPVDEATMRGSTVVVGSAGEGTIWLIGGSLPGVGSNYDMLIGYRSLAEQQAAADLLLRGALAAARAEIHRALRDEIVIPGARRRR
jgi:hypothetical protein